VPLLLPPLYSPPLGKSRLINEQVFADCLTSFCMPSESVVSHVEEVGLTTNSSNRHLANVRLTDGCNNFSD